MLKFYSFDKPPDTTLFSSYLRTFAVYYVEATRLLLLLLLFTGFFILPAHFLCFLRLSFLKPYAKDYALMYHSLCLSRSCLSSFRCPATSAFVCMSRSFGALFLRVPHRGCTGFYLANRPNTVSTKSSISQLTFFHFLILQLLCSMLMFHYRFLPICVSGAFAYQVSSSVSVSFLQPYALAIALLNEGLKLCQKIRLYGNL